MKMPQNILVVISGKRQEHPALQRALKFAEYNDVHLHLLNVIYEPVLELTDVLSGEHRAEMKREYLGDRYLYMDTIAAELDKKGISCSVRVEWCSEVHRAIEEVVEELKPDLVIKRITAEHLSINPFALPLDRHLLRYCQAPLLLIKEGDWNNSPILATLDVLANDAQHIELNKLILESAKLITHLSGCDLHTVSAYITHSMSAAIEFPHIDLDALNANTEKYHHQQLDKLEHELLIDVTQQHIIAGVPEQVISNVVKQIDAQLVIVGTVARKGVRAALLGNTVEAVLAELNCDVLALKQLE